jgi:hypothetical protein
MRRLLLVIAVVAGCSEPVTITVVRVEARPAVRDVDRLDVTFANGNATISESFAVAGRRFPLSFSVETPGRRGVLAMTARALDDDGQLAALGSAEAVIVPGGDASATMVLEPADFGVNTRVAGSQRLAWTNAAAGVQVAAAPDGTFTIGFTDDCGELLRCDLWGRRFDARATPVETEIEASDAQFNINRTAVFGNDPAMAVAPDGTLLAAWTTFDEVLAATITPTGGPGRTVETIVSTGNDPGDPAAVALPDGRYLVVWSEVDAVSSERVIRGRMLGPTGFPAVNPETNTTGVFTISTSSGGSPDRPVVARLAGDTLETAIVWRAGTSILARFTTAQGRLAPGGQIEVIRYANLHDVWSPQVAATPDGRFVIGWAHRTFGGEADDGEIVARKVSSPAATPLGADARLGRGLPDSASRFGLATSDGPMVATWHACNVQGDDSNCGIRLRVFRSNGLAVGDDAIVNTTTTGNQVTPSIAWLGPAGDGGFAITWTDDSRVRPDTAETGIRARVVYPAFDDAAGVLGARCGASAPPCGDGQVCMPGSSDELFCHARCDPGGPAPHCPGGGVCTTSGDESGCIF